MNGAYNDWMATEDANNQCQRMSYYEQEDHFYYEIGTGIQTFSPSHYIFKQNFLECDNLALTYGLF